MIGFLVFIGFLALIAIMLLKLFIAITAFILHFIMPEPEGEKLFREHMRKIREKYK